jgi:hypothetical protein
MRLTPPNQSDHRELGFIAGNDTELEVGSARRPRQNIIKDEFCCPARVNLDLTCYGALGGKVPFWHGFIRPPEIAALIEFEGWHEECMIAGGDRGNRPLGEFLFLSIVNSSHVRAAARPAVLPHRRRSRPPVFAVEGSMTDDRPWETPLAMRATSSARSLAAQPARIATSSRPSFARNTGSPACHRVAS